MGILRTNTLSGIGTDGPVFDGVTRLDTFGYVVPPVGVTSDRTLVGVTTAQGSIRFNTDSQKLEFYAQDQWWEMVIDTPALAVSSNTEAGARGVFAGGYKGGSPINTANSDYINIASTGNALSFGDLAVQLRYQAGCSSNTRGLTFSGINPASSLVTTIYKTTISSTGSHASFGDITPSRYGHSCWSSQTRAISFAGFTNPANTNNISYVTIAADGNAITFGELVDNYNFRYGGTTGNKTRAIAYGGYNQSPAVANVNNIQYVTISTTGNATDFGDLSTITADMNGSTSNGLRSAINVGTSVVSTLDQVRPTTLGNSYRFGDLTVARRYSPMHSCMSSPTRGIFGGGFTSTVTNTIDYITFATEGNAVDFGDMVGNSGSGYSSYSSFSNAHGGL